MLCRLPGKAPSFTSLVEEGIQSKSFDPCVHYQSDPFARSSTKKEDASETELKRLGIVIPPLLLPALLGLFFFLLLIPILLGLATLEYNAMAAISASLPTGSCLR